MIEDDLKQLRLATPAGSVRQRALAAADGALKDRRVGRLITGTAFVSVALAFMTSLFGDRPAGEAPSSRRVDPGTRPVIFVFDRSSLEGGE